MSVQTVTALLILGRYGELNAMSCPTGRGSAQDIPMSLLPTVTSKSEIYQHYKIEWENIVDSVVNQRISNTSRPDSPLHKDSFCRAWKKFMPTLKILNSGSDFCDTCTEMKNIADNMKDPTTKEIMEKARQKHRDEASTEFKLYREIQSKVKQIPVGNDIHLIFDFAEKILLPSLLKQPGQLHFITGIKFDFFGVSSSNYDETYIYGLPEGHWPGGKTCNEVSSMLHHTLLMHRAPL